MQEENSKVTTTSTPSVPIQQQTTGQDQMVASLGIKMLQPTDQAKTSPTVMRAEELAFKIYSKTEQTVKNVLDTLHSSIVSNPTKNFDEELCGLYLFLNNLRTDFSEADWQDVIKNVIQKHPIIKIILLDPCTKRSFEKPRGYPGDAELLDYFYRLNTVSDNPLGKKILDLVATRPAAEAVRKRAELIAGYIDKAVVKKDSPRILSIACGHLREARLSQALMDQKIGELVALDHDPATLDVIKRDLADYRITTLQGSVMALIKGKKEDKLGKFDLVYSAGLFDYLSDRMGQALTEYMFGLLNPGGTVLITNFLPDIPDQGYMEAFMDWKLIYREIPQIEILAQNLNFKNLQEKRIFRNENNNILYLELIKTK